MKSTGCPAHENLPAGGPPVLAHHVGFYTILVDAANNPITLPWHLQAQKVDFERLFAELEVAPTTTTTKDTEPDPSIDDIPTRRHLDISYHLPDAGESRTCCVQPQISRVYFFSQTAIYRAVSVVGWLLSE